MDEGVEDMEVYVWSGEEFQEGDESEDPLKIDLPVNSQNSSLVPRVVKREPDPEPGPDFPFSRTQEMCQSPCDTSATNLDHYTDPWKENTEEYVSQPVRWFMCKMCSQPYKMVCRRNLMIRGFCNNCLYSDASGSKTCDGREKIPNDYLGLQIITMKCSYCGDNFSDNYKLNKHLSSQKNCKKCFKKFCSLNEYEKHLILHDKDPVMIDSVSVAQNDDVSSLSDVRRFKQNVVFPENDSALVSETISGKSFEKPEAELHNVKLSKLKRKSDQIDSKVKCEICSSMVLKSTISDHMRSHENLIHPLSNSRRSVNSSGNEVKLNSSCKFSSNNNETKPVMPVPSSSLSSPNDTKNEILSFCKYDYLCELCKGNYDNLNVLKDHLLSDIHVNMIVAIVSSNLSCKLCKGNFNNIDDLKAHLIKDDHIMSYHIKKTKINVFSCEVCCKSFVSEADYQTHQLLEGHQINKVENNLFTADKSIKTEKQSPEKDSSLKNQSEILKRCKTCNRDFSTETGIKNHLRVSKHERYIDNLNRLLVVRVGNIKEEVIGKKKSDELKKKTEEDVFVCKTCNIVCSSIVGLKKHITYFNHKPYEFNESKADKKPVVTDSIVKDKNCNNDENTVLEYYCKTCNKGFSNKTSLKKHMTYFNHVSDGLCNLSDNNTATDIVEKKFTCDTCSKTFDNITSLKKHVTFLSHVSNWWDNLNRSSNTTSKSESTCESVSKQDTLWCKLCKVSFNSKESLIKHQTAFNHDKKINDPKEGKVECVAPNCSCEFDTRGDMLYHMCIEHQTSVCKVLMKCVTCNIILQSVYSFFKHSKCKSHIDKCLKSDYVNGSCKLCNIKYKGVIHFESHISSNSHVGMYMKFVAEKKLPVSVEDSVSAQKVDERIHSCKFCSKKFNYFSDLYKHLKRNHKSNNILTSAIFKCSFCQKRFGRKRYLNRHIKNVCSKKKEPCGLCSQKFNYPHQLILHLKHHEQFDE